MEKHATSRKNSELLNHSSIDVMPVVGVLPMWQLVTSFIVKIHTLDQIT